MAETKIPCGGFHYDPNTIEFKDVEGDPTMFVKQVPVEIPDLSDKYISTQLKGQPNGVAELDNGGKLLASQLPSGVDKAEEYETRESFPPEGKDNIVYVDLSTKLEYRWSGTTYVQVPTGLALGNTAETAFRGDHGEEIYLATINGHPVRSNPVLSASDVKADPEGSAYYEANLPEHTTLVVTAQKEGISDVVADYTADEINTHAQKGMVVLRFQDIENDRLQTYPYAYRDKQGRAVFIRNFIVESESKVKRCDVVIDYKKDVTVEYHILSTLELGLTNVKVGDSIEAEMVNAEGKVTKWKVTPAVHIDDKTISKKTVMSSKEMINRLSCTKLYEGHQAVFYPIEGQVLDIIAEIVPVQNGSGEPSTSNVRDISGWESISINVDNDIDTKSYVTEFGKTVYEGTYEPITGSLTVTMASKEFNGSEPWEVRTIPSDGRTPIFKLTMSDLNSSLEITKQMCNIFKTNPTTNPFESDTVWTAGNDVYVGNGIVQKFNGSLDEFKAQLAKTPMQIVYELQDQEESKIIDQKVVAIAGKNVVSASTGDVSVLAQVIGCTHEEVEQAISDYLNSPAGKALIKAIINNEV